MYVFVWNIQAVFLGHQGVDVHAVCLQNKLSHMTVEENALSLLYGVSTTDNRSVSCQQFRLKLFFTTPAKALLAY